MSKFTSFILLSLMTSSAVYAADNTVWQCTIGAGGIEVYAQDPVQFGRWGEPHFTRGQQVEVVIKSADSDQSGTHVGRVTSQKIGTVTKHAPMASYSVKVKGLSQTLHLVLLGIDEFQERQKCEWSIQ